jgi:hypothetical protein
MRGVQKTFWSLKIHQRLIKPPYPVYIACPACGHKLISVNADMIEISNDFGLPWSEIKSFYKWQQIKHSCGSKINMIWMPDK